MNTMWFRQDLRLADNPALLAALQGADALTAIYVLDPAIERGGASRWWLHHGLAALAADIERLGGRLILRRGSAATLIPELAGGGTVHAARAHEPGYRAIDAEIAAKLGDRLVLHRGASLYDPDQIRNRTGGVCGTYSAFARACAATGEPSAPSPAPARLPPAPDLASDPLASWQLLPTRPNWAGGLRETWTPGEAGAHARLRHFLDHAAQEYGRARNVPGEEGTSRLSPHLHWGEISPAAVWHEAGSHPVRGTERFRSELMWRDFGQYMLWHHPTLGEAPLRPEFAGVGWRADPAILAAWQRGQTGIPIVDAGMRQLWHTGWMHNRVRMIVGSFLIKHLLHDWREGVAWFHDTLVDADQGSNGMNWQWVAGTGIDASPFFRVFNPVTQAEKFDAAGAYVRAYVPELGRLPDAHLHAPWLASDAVLAEAGIRLGTDYPRPLIDLAEGRARALAEFGKARAT